MSDAPLFQNMDEQEAAYGSSEDTANNQDTSDQSVGIPAAALGGGGVGGPAQGAGTQGVLPSAIAPSGAANDDTDMDRVRDSSG